MCDDRERLIGYLYGECDTGERGEIERHLESCEVCRAEIGGLRRTRQHLLAWEVPDHEPVWRPVAPMEPVAWWRQVPTWAMAAAASLTFLVGAAGGMVTRFVLPAAAPVQAAAVQPAAEVVPAGVSQADMAALEQRLLQAMRTEVDAKIALVSAHQPAPSGPRVTPASVERLAGQVDDLVHWRGQQIDFNRATVEDIRNIIGRVGAVETRSDQFHSVLMQRASAPGK